MGVCGYNDAIGNSISSFAEGMIEAIKERADSQSMEILEVIDNEILELKAIIALPEDTESIALLRGLDTFALSYFLIIKKRMEDGAFFDEACLDIADKFKRTLYEIDAQHKVLRGNSKDIPKDLADWIIRQIT